MKRLILPFLSLITLHSAIYANVDPKVSEICLQAEDFQGCIESFSSQKKKNYLISLILIMLWNFLRKGIL